jgi:hypothetical protein
MDANNISNRKAGYLSDKDIQVAIKTTKRNCVRIPVLSVIDKNSMTKSYTNKHLSPYCLRFYLKYRG